MERNFSQVPENVNTEPDQTISPELSRTIQLNPVKKESLRLGRILESSRENTPAKLDLFKKLLANNAVLYNELFRLERTHTLSPKDRELIEKLSLHSASLQENLNAFIQFGEEIITKNSGGQVLDESDLSMRRSALDNIYSKILADIEYVSQVPTASAGWHVPVLEKIKNKLAIAIVASTSLLVAGDLGTSPTRPETVVPIARIKDSIPSKKLSSEELGKSLLKEKEGNDAHSDMRGEGEPGKFEKAQPMGKIQFTPLSTITDPLWVTSYTTRNTSGKYSIVEATGEGTAASDVQATVTLEPISINPGDEISLPVPVGYTFSYVDVGNIPIELSHKKESIIFRGVDPVKDVCIKYEVVKVTKKFEIQTKPELFQRTIPEKNTIDTLRESDDVPEILGKHFSNFTYMTSNDMQNIIDKIPADFEEMVGAVRVGDCDVLSQYAEGLLNEAGKKTLTARGFLAENGVIDQARAHAKLVYFDKNDKPHLYESTGGTSRAYVNLKFIEKDKTNLLNLAQDIKETDTPDVKQNKLIHLGDEMRLMLKSSFYDQFLMKPEVQEILGSSSFLDTMRSLLGDAWDNFNKADNTAGWIVALTIFSLTSIYSAIKGFEKLDVSLYKQTKIRKSKSLAKAAEFFSEIQTTSNEEDELKSDPESLQQLSSIYKRFPDLSKVIKLKDVFEMKPYDRRQFIRMLAFVDQVSGSSSAGLGEPFTLIKSIFRSSAWLRSAERARADGQNIEDVIEDLSLKLIDQKKKSELLQNIPKKIDELMATKMKFMISNLSSIDQIAYSSLNNVLKILKIDDGSEDAVSNKNSHTQGTEFEEFQIYQPGMDTRRIDWKATGKSDNILSRKFSPESSSEKVQGLNIVVNVVNSSDIDLAKLGSLILFLQHNPQKGTIAELNLLCDGEVVRRFNGELLKKLTSPHEGIAAVRSLLITIRTLALDSLSSVLKKSYKKRLEINLKDMSMVKGQNEKYLLFGNTYYDNDKDFLKADDFIKI